MAKRWNVLVRPGCARTSWPLPLRAPALARRQSVRGRHSRGSRSRISDLRGDGRTPHLFRRLQRNPRAWSGVWRSRPTAGQGGRSL